MEGGSLAGQTRRGRSSRPLLEQQVRPYTQPTFRKRQAACVPWWVGAPEDRALTPPPSWGSGPLPGPWLTLVLSGDGRLRGGGTLLKTVERHSTGQLGDPGPVTDCYAGPCWRPLETSKTTLLTFPWSPAPPVHSFPSTIKAAPGQGPAETGSSNANWPERHGQDAGPVRSAPGAAVTQSPGLRAGPGPLPLCALE